MVHSEYDGGRGMRLNIPAERERERERENHNIVEAHTVSFISKSYLHELTDTVINATQKPKCPVVECLSR